MTPSGKLETKGHADVEEGAQVRSLWGLVGKSEMRSTHQAAQNTGAGPAAAEDVLAATCAGSFKGRMGKNGACGYKGILHVFRQQLDYALKDKPL